MKRQSFFRTLASGLFGSSQSAEDQERIATLLEDFQRDGYVIMRGCIEHDLIDSFWEEVAYLQKTEGELSYGIVGGVLKNRDVLDGTYTEDTSRLRIVGIENFSKLAPSLILHPAIAGFLRAYYENPPTCIQSLTYRYSSQQGAHSDKYLVSDRKSVV